MKIYLINRKCSWKNVANCRTSPPPEQRSTFTKDLIIGKIKSLDMAEDLEGPNFSPRRGIPQSSLITTGVPVSSPNISQNVLDQELEIARKEIELLQIKSQIAALTQSHSETLVSFQSLKDKLDAIETNSAAVTRCCNCTHGH